MSSSTIAPRRGMSAAVAGALALALLALAALGSASKADAAFSTEKCAGADIVGEGASFAKEAHKVFNNNLKTFYCIGTPGFGVRDVEYKAEGSGAGRLSMKVRDGAPRFGMSDEPPIASEIAQMNAGTEDEPAATDSDPSDNGKIHVVPAAVGAVVPLVNFPDGCDVEKLASGSVTSATAALKRVRFTKEQFEKVWAKDSAFDTWGEVFPELDEAGCEDVPIIRVVRYDESGTSFAFKDYLDSINGARGWKTTYAFGAHKTQEWPNAVFGERADCGAGVMAPGSEADATDHLTTGCSKGNGALVSKLIATDGSIGYSDLATARSASPSLAVNPAGGDNDTYWTQVQNGADAFVEPTADSDGYRTDGELGANCQATEFDGVPSSTFGDWSQASGVNSTAGYGICTMTYGLVFDDNADVWGSSPEEESKARTVKDYWENILSEGAQGRLFGNDYSPLPPGVAAISRAGIAAVDWNKGEGGGGSGGGGSTPGGGSTDAGDSSTPAPLPLKPSNLFSLPRKSISSKTGAATISVKLPGAGRLVMLGTARVQVAQRKNKRRGKRRLKKSRTIKVGRVVLSAGKAGTYNLTLKPSGAAKKELRKKGKLRTTLKLTFTPNGGEAKTTTTGVTLKLKKKSNKRKGKRHQR